MSDEATRIEQLEKMLDDVWLDVPNEAREYVFELERLRADQAAEIESLNASKAELEAELSTSRANLQGMNRIHAETAEHDRKAQAHVAELKSLAKPRSTLNIPEDGSTYWLVIRAQFVNGASQLIEQVGWLPDQREEWKADA